MTEPQKEYIITHEHAKRIWEHLRDNTHGNASWFWGEIEKCPHPYTSADKVLDEPIGMSSTDIMLLAHDEWKRREERKHNHPEEHWVPGFINGFLTSKKWAREYVKKLLECE